MSNILIINGAKKFAHSNGQLNDTLTEVAESYLRDAGHDVKSVRAESEWEYLLVTTIGGPPARM